MTQPPPQWNYQPPPPLSESDQVLWSVLIHIGGIFFGFLPSLIGYLVLRDRGEFIRQHSRAALNFQITMTIAAFAGAILSIIIVGVFVLIAVQVTVIVCSILAAVAAGNRRPYSYPLTANLVK